MSINLVMLLFCLCMSLIGTMIGALIGVSVKNPSEKALGFTLSLASGLMIIVSVFELIPEAIQKINIKHTCMFFLFGVVIILIINYFSYFYFKDNTIKMAILIALGIMLHNFPEGIIMGVGFMSGGSLGIKMSILIAIHDIPEGISVAAPLKYSKVSSAKILAYTFLVGFPALIGAIIGMVIGNISDIAIGGSLSTAAGIMIYVTLFEMIPKSMKLSGYKRCILGTIIGCMLGIFMILFM
ncbi:ZIP family metal transporter [Hathewaya histolytica]|uniref:Zinc uptake transporter n=1 Tax=Hathewaya histolytica TaxID=1498 RepID=A0A4V6KEB4_HATHI|nr:ZIP family metal transporter [Hathewaya histolytica]VTQ94177.1 zinc uptake transporter [Hathewaya histolytica]